MRNFTRNNHFTSERGRKEGGGGILQILRCATTQTEGRFLKRGSIWSSILIFTVQILMFLMKLELDVDLELDFIVKKSSSNRVAH